MMWSVSNSSGGVLKLGKDCGIWFDHKFSFSLTDKKSNYHLELEDRECSAPVTSRRVSSTCKPKAQTIQQALRGPSLYRNHGHPKVELLLAPPL